MSGGGVTAGRTPFFLPRAPPDGRQRTKNRRAPARSRSSCGEERLVIVHEVERHARPGMEGEKTEEIAAAVRQGVAEPLAVAHRAAERLYQVLAKLPGGGALTRKALSRGR